MIIALLIFPAISPAACGQILSLSLGHQFAELTGDYEDRGIDIDGDEKLDYLLIDVGVRIIIPGEYSVTGYLYDRGGREVVWSADHRNFTDGKQSMQLAFDGKSIEKKRLNGPFRLGNLTFTWGSRGSWLILLPQ